MREILFKAKRKDNGEWVEGYYIYHIKRTPSPVGDRVKPEDEQHVIMCDGFSDWNMPRDTVHFDIDPKTLCQYTGLKDKNGKRIWENDIVSFMDATSTENGYYERNCIGRVAWDCECACFRVSGTLSAESWEILQDCVVIGNIFDNPELLKPNTPTKANTPTDTSTGG